MPHREQEIFGIACELRGAQRAAFLDEACAGDAVLRARVEALLAAAEAAGGFLGGDEAEMKEGPGARIGAYVLQQKLGEGGFGVVYQAEQQQPVRRTVALKIIKLGMDTRAVVARFEAERQALALMDHPHIARVFDGGATATGRPYFVMERVEGRAITTFCSEECLPVRARLALFIQVCRAVHHAHQKGIIHRDLKPSNVLVVRENGRVAAKVIDFGVAKATREPLTAHTLVSRLHLFVGTPAYMSPEQFGERGADLDTRSDVYSLGAVLYELLVDVPPVEAQALGGSAAPMAWARAAADVVAPSQRFRSFDARRQQRVAAGRAEAPARLGAELKGDLDQIVLKCLEAERERRYDTAEDLARDLESHLRDEPVQARPATMLYRAGKFVRRNKRLVGATGVFAAALLAFAAYHAQRLTAARDRAEHEMEKARKASELIVNALSVADPFRSPDGADATIDGILGSVATRAREEFPHDPDVRAEILNAVGRVYLRTGRHAEAGQILTEALAAGRASGVRGAQLSQTLNDLGVLARELGHNEEALLRLGEALQVRRALYPQGHNDVAATLVEIGRIYRVMERVDLAEPLQREALQIRRAVLGEHRETATSLSDLGHLLWQEGRIDEAEPILVECAAMDERTLGHEHPNTASGVAGLALIAEAKGDLSRAEALLRDAVGVVRRTVGDNHWRTARFMAQLAGIFRAQGRLPEAAALLDDALAVTRRTVGPDNLQTLLTEIDRARVHLSANQPAEALRLLEHAVPLLSRIYPATGWRVATARGLAGQALAQLGRDAEAEKLLEEALRELPEAGGLRGEERPRVLAALKLVRTRLGR